jgi:hypothetical protein
MVETMLVDNTNVSNVAILPILNGTVLFTHVEPAIKQHPDMHQKPVEDIFDDGIRGHDIDGYDDGNLAGEC